MAYNGYLIKVGNYTIPHSLIQAESYKVTWNSQDLDSYRDANGVLHRDALSTFVPKVEFNVKPMLDNTELATFLNNIKTNYTNATERKLSASMYVPETDSYVNANVYMVDFTPEIYFADYTKIRYKSFRMAFVGYGD